MGSLAQEARERVVGLRKLVRYIQTVSTTVNKLRRLVVGMTRRRRHLVEEDDLLKILDAIRAVIGVITGFNQLTTDLQNIFRL